MSREQHIPFVLWVCTALLAHVSGSVGADQASRIAHEVAQVRLFAGQVKGEIAHSEPIEVSLLTAPEPPQPPPEPTADRQPENRMEPPKPPEPKPIPEPPKPEPEKPQQKKAPEPKPVAILPGQSAAAALPVGL